MERRTRRRAALAVLALALVAVHLGLADALLQAGLGDAGAGVPRRLDVAFVRTLQPAPPPEAPATRPAPARRAPTAVAQAAAPAASEPASAPEPTAVAETQAPPETPVAVGDETLGPPPEPPVPLPGMPQPVASADAAAGAPPFEWPPSTQLSYTLTGHYRGPVQGEATVEWLRVGWQYQVIVEVKIGPSFAPLVTRRLSSDGEVTEHGLRPRRYDELTRAAFRDARQLTVHFDDHVIRLANGRELPMIDGVQDSASQFVQMTWLFITQPALLEPGRSVQLPLALPRRADTWTYDVIGRETVHAPFGDLDTVHVKPRGSARPGKDLTAEMWVAPTVQYLPVRIVIRQDDDTWVDLLIRQLPRQATPS
ncbi:DUF3108 domain-containing protein [Rubrivivax sp. JA1026]|uniref:DUF3108 domain-containing protein n=1 Tax=Rubrivivax sp. JA1026 TaxID=2710888 RepID=UPI0013E91AF6|nr:DUF3108 domain-containing protein [Rubrivivax sp. JA1026]